MKNLIQAAVVTLFVASTAQAQQAVQWKVENGGNGHWYATTSSPGISWSDAASMSALRGGALATLTTAQENNFVVAAFQTSGPRYPWIGLRQSPDAVEPGGGWAWVSGEPLSWTNWSPSEPNGDGSFDADQANIWLVGEPDLGRPLGTWNDWHVGGPDGCMIEWSADCNNDGIVDYGQCWDGSLLDSNSNNVPDCCESGTPCAPNIILNSGFEIGPSETDCTWVVHSEGGSFVPGWTVTAASIDRVRISASCPPSTESWMSFQGEFTIDLDGGTHGGAISQTVATEPGSTYLLTFQLTGNCAPGVKRMSVEIDSAKYPFEHACSGTNPQPWSERSIEFTAASSATNIVFKSLSTDGRNGAVIDLVRLIRVDPQQPTCTDADLFPTGTVNGADLGALLSQWGEAPAGTASDLDRDGAVDGTDLGILLAFWGPCPN
jgi:choice-of-anchor C domain-containing protein